MKWSDTMARPSKSIDNIKSHATKAEIKQRKEAEKAALSGIKIRKSAEVEQDAVANAEYERVIELLTAVGKNDALYESVINDYCIYKSDIARYTNMRERIESDLDSLYDEDMDAGERYKIKSAMYKQIMDCDKQIQAFQKKRFDIEKENGFTIASALRSIPKQVNVKENPLAKALLDGD